MQVSAASFRVGYEGEDGGGCSFIGSFKACAVFTVVWLLSFFREKYKRGEGGGDGFTGIIVHVFKIGSLLCCAQSHR
jgi:hypothetical protein